MQKRSKMKDALPLQHMLQGYQAQMHLIIVQLCQTILQMNHPQMWTAVTTGRATMEWGHLWWHYSISILYFFPLTCG